MECDTEAGGIRLLVVQPEPKCPAAELGRWLREAGAELDVVRPCEERFPESLDGYCAVVCLGGAMGALDDDRHPWLAEVRRQLAEAYRSQLPILGVCLGAQLLAVALGGRVRAMAEGPEVGTRLVAKRDAAGDDPLFAEVPHLPDVLQFHGDEVAALPAGAQLLAASPRCENQAFRLGSRAYGLQFHVETTPEIVQSWADADPAAATTARPGELDREHLARVHADIAETWRPFAARFVRLAAGTIEPAVGGDRRLPLA